MIRYLYVNGREKSSRRGSLYPCCEDPRVLIARIHMLKLRGFSSSHCEDRYLFIARILVCTVCIARIRVHSLWGSSYVLWVFWGSSNVILRIHYEDSCKHSIYNQRILVFIVHIGKILAVNSYAFIARILVGTACILRGSSNLNKVLRGSSHLFNVSRGSSSFVWRGSL